MPKITEIYAFVVEDSGPDDEGILAMPMGELFLPFVGGDMKRVDQIRPIAKALGGRTGKKVKLLRFTGREELEEI